MPLVRRLLEASSMLHPTLRELRALPPERPPVRLALVVGLTTALVVIAGTAVLAFAAPPDRSNDVLEQVRRRQADALMAGMRGCRGPAP